MDYFELWDNQEQDHWTNLFHLRLVERTTFILILIFNFLVKSCDRTMQVVMHPFFLKTHPLQSLMRCLTFSQYTSCYICVNKFYLVDI
jgi:hypothetical protein